MRVLGSKPSRIIVAGAMLMASAGGYAQFAPLAPRGERGEPPDVGTSTDPGAPALIRIPDTALADRFAVVPSYRRGAATGHIKVVGAFQVKETEKRHLVAAWSVGFLPVTLLFDDGACYSLQADYVGGTLSNGRMSKATCDDRKPASERPPSPPDGSRLAFIGSSWSYAAWVDKEAGTTIVTAPYADAFKPLFTARMATVAMMAMNGPDYPGGNVTLVGRVGGRLTIATLEVGY